MIEKQWYPYTEWEDLAMWMPCKAIERPKKIKAALEIMADTETFGRYMLQVLRSFPNSSAHNLSETQSNRRAWIGQAACFLGAGVPDDVTREAWGLITSEQRESANKKADEAIARWEFDYERENFKLGRKMGGQGVFEWNP